MKVIIKKVFNNNVVLAKDLSKSEIVVMGRGIAFKKRVGEEVESNLIEKTFILKQKDASEKFKLLLEDIPSEHISLCYDIIEYAKNMLKIELNDCIYFTLTDHISNALKLHEEGFSRPNPLVWEIKKFYPKEYNIALKALEFIESEIEKKLPEDEAGNIVFHLINAEVNSNYNNSNNEVTDMAKQTKMIKDILNIVKYTYKIELDENSLNYERFVTHLRFFFQRIKGKNKIESPGDDFLLKQVKNKYEEAYKCMLKIERYLEKELDDDEKLYLTLHIKRVTKR